MSVNVSAVPPWKQALLEKKRRQEEESRRKVDSESQRLSQMPAWKRDILMKKQQQKNSMVFVSKPSTSPKKSSDSADGDIYRIHSSSKSTSSSGNEAIEVEVDAPAPAPAPGGVEEEQEAPRINPIAQNPLLRKDIKSKTTHSYKHHSYPGPGGGGDNETGHNTHSSVPNHTSWSDTDGHNHIHHRHSANCDDVFIREEEEVAYGRGFVHKLLQRFSHLSTKDEGEKANVPRRASSTENILEDRLSHRGYSSHGSRTSLSPSRTRSTESLNSQPPLSPRSPRSTGSADNSAVLPVLPVHDTSLSDTQSVAHSEDIASEPCLTHDGENNEIYRSSSCENLVEELPRPNTVRTTRHVFESIAVASVPKPDSSVKKRTAPEPPSSNSNASPERNGHSTNYSGKTDYGKFYNDTLSRKAGSGLASHYDEPLDKEPTSNGMVNGVADPESDTEEPAEPALKEEALQSIRSAGKSWHFTGSSSAENVGVKKPTGVKSPPSSPKKSFLYPASKPLEPPKDHPEKNGNNNLPPQNNGFTDAARKRRAPPPPPQPDRSPVNGQAVSIISIENNTEESTTDSISPPSDDNTDNFNFSTSDLPEPVVEAASDHSKPELTKKPDPNRLNLNLNLNDIHRKNDSNDTSSNEALTSLNNLKNNLKKVKRPAPSGPGSMLIRPASNLVVGTTKTEYLNLTQYNDVKTGEFAPAKKRPSYYDDFSDEEDVPVTNIDDYLGDDVPVTNIDDISVSPRADANDNVLKKSKYNFVGANVKLGKNLLVKTRGGKKMKLQFHEQLTSLFEYPSEQHLLDTMPPEPGDLDYNRGVNRLRASDSTSSDEDDARGPVSSGLRSNPGVGAGGSLSSYKSKVAMDYQFGMESPRAAAAPRPSRPEQAPEDVHVKPAEDEDFTWSDNQTSDLLF